MEAILLVARPNCSVVNVLLRIIQMTDSYENVCVCVCACTHNVRPGILEGEKKKKKSPFEKHGDPDVTLLS